MTEFILPTVISEIAALLGNKAGVFTGKTVILTGGRGFLGRYFTEVFLHLNETVFKEPCNLVVLDNHDVIKPVDWDDDVHFIIHAAGITIGVTPFGGPPLKLAFGAV